MSLYTPGWKRRARALKAAAGYRCTACGRKRREHAWQILRPREMHAHHLFRAPGSPMRCLCEACHERAHRFDKRSPLPLWADSLLLIWGTRLARLAAWGALIALTLLALHWR